jgi:hypothetical protein
VLAELCNARDLSQIATAKTIYVAGAVGAVQPIFEAVLKLKDEESNCNQIPNETARNYFSRWLALPERVWAISQESLLKSSNRSGNKLWMPVYPNSYPLWLDRLFQYAIFY